MSDLDDEEQDFQDPVTVNTSIYNRKRARINNTQHYMPSKIDLEEATLCTLCQMPWNTNGVHVTVNMKCGHVFGKSCIQKYIKESISKEKYARCPVCDQIVTKSEPRRIWPNKVVPCDENDLRELKREHEEADAILQTLLEKTQRVNYEICKIKEELNKYQLDEALKKKMQFQSVLPQKHEVQPEICQQYTLQHTFSIPNEKYRVSELIPDQDMAVLSVVNNTNRIFGIRKINIHDTSLTEFIPNHTAQIKDVKHVPSNNIILSTGFDKTLKLTSLVTNQVVLSYQLDAPGWSCATNPVDPNYVYCGTTNNRLLIFDIRNTKGSVQTLTELTPKKCMSPIHCIEVSDNKILCSNLARSYYWIQNSGRDYTYCSINEFADFKDENADEFKNFGMVYRDQVLLTSLRNKTSCIYYVAQFEINKLVMGWRYENKNQKQLSMPRNTFYKRNGEVHLCFADNEMVHIRDKNELIQTITVENPVLDIKYIEKQNMLTILTENELQVYTNAIK